jgi:hypothetical protein
MDKSSAALKANDAQLAVESRFSGIGKEFIFLRLQSA